MICVYSQKLELAKKLRESFNDLNIRCCVVQPDEQKSLDVLYGSEIMAAVVDSRIPGLPDYAWLDMLASLGRHIPIVVLADEDSFSISLSSRHADTVTWLMNPSDEEVISVLDACGAIGVNRKLVDRGAVPLYNPQVPLHMLQSNGALCVMVVDAASFRKVAIEYGGEAYRKLQDCFRQTLYDMWGTTGFRSADTLCRRSPHGNTYFLFLEQSRATGSIPIPGVMERMADRLVDRLRNALWKEVVASRATRFLPEYLRYLPDFSIGYASALYNPCIDPLETIERLLDTGMDAANVQASRMNQRRRELIQTLVQTSGLLKPHYQAIFRLQGITKTMVDDVKSLRSIKPIESMLFGFESLIRVQPDAVDSNIGPEGVKYLDPKYLFPDVLFGLAGASKIGLELDQACIQLAVRHSVGLPGTLMINILPRNLYHIDRLKHLIMDRNDLTFEVSESEAINNLRLMLKARENLERMHIGIAMDDFGKGHTGLERIMHIKPELIKMDRSLITNIHEDLPKQAFVSGLIQAARMSNSTVLAEGVELWEEAEVLQKLGVEFIQGFLLHRPSPAEQIQKDLEIDFREEDEMESVA